MTLPTFIYSADAAALKATGAPATPTAQPVFAALVSDAASLIADDKGARVGLRTQMVQALTEQAESAFAALQHDGALPDGMRAEIDARARAMTDAIADAVGYAIVASIVNFVGTSGATGIPILTFATTEATPLTPALPVRIGLDPATGNPLVLLPY